jgi:hypothetical protein
VVVAATADIPRSCRRSTTTAVRSSALVRTAAETTDNDEYDVRLGIEWTGQQPLSILTKDNMGFTYDGTSVPLHRYTPVETTVNAVEPAADFFWHVHDFAHDCVNQGGISNVLMIKPPAATSRRSPDSPQAPHRARTRFGSVRRTVPASCVRRWRARLRVPEPSPARPCRQRSAIPHGTCRSRCARRARGSLGCCRALR